MVMGLVQDEDMEWVNNVEFFFLIKLAVDKSKTTNCIKNNCTQLKVGMNRTGFEKTN
jgi:hypothetical protein